MKIGLGDAPPATAMSFQQAAQAGATDLDCSSSETGIQCPWYERPVWAPGGANCVCQFDPVTAAFTVVSAPSFPVFKLFPTLGHGMGFGAIVLPPVIGGAIWAVGLYFLFKGGR